MVHCVRRNVFSYLTVCIFLLSVMWHMHALPEAAGTAYRLLPTTLGTILTGYFKKYRFFIVNSLFWNAVLLFVEIFLLKVIPSFVNSVTVSELATMQQQT